MDGWKGDVVQVAADVIAGLVFALVYVFSKHGGSLRRQR